MVVCVDGWLGLTEGVLLNIERRRLLFRYFGFYLVDVCLEDVLSFQLAGYFFAACKLWLHIEEHLDHGERLEGLGHCLDFFAAVRTILLFVEPVRQAAATEDVKAWSQLDRLVKKLVADATLMLFRQLLEKPLILLISNLSHLNYWLLLFSRLI